MQGIRRSAIGVCLLLVWLAIGPAAAQNQLAFTQADAERGDNGVVIWLVLRNPEISIEGFSVALDFDGARTQLAAVDTVGTSIEGETQFFISYIDPVEHWSTLGAVMDLENYGALEPGGEYTVARYRFDVLADAPAGVAPVAFAPGGHSPGVTGIPVRTIVSNVGLDVVPDELIDGAVRVRPAPISNLACVFDRDAGVARSTWTNGEIYDEIRILRDGEEIAVLPGTATRYEDPQFPFGEVSYAAAPLRSALPPLQSPPSCTLTIIGFRRGDANQDDDLTISDAVIAIRTLFTPDAPAPTCLDALDANDDGGLSLSDTISILRYLFLAGPALPAPVGACGLDPTVDSLDCSSYGACQ